MFLEVNENEYLTYWKLWDTAKAVLRGKFRVMNVYIKRTERSQINDLMIHLKILKQEQANPKTSRRREIIKTRAKVNEIETKKQNVQRTNETKRWFFEKIHNIDRLLENLTKTRREKTQISKNRNAKGEIPTNTMEILQIIRDYFENLHSNKFENFEEITDFYILMTIKN
jgi:hypothetical protein